jgi:hypothetical protein
MVMMALAAAPLRGGRKSGKRERPHLRRDAINRVARSSMTAAREVSLEEATANVAVIEIGSKSLGSSYASCPICTAPIRF